MGAMRTGTEMMVLSGAGQVKWIGIRFIGRLKNTTVMNESVLELLTKLKSDVREMIWPGVRKERNLQTEGVPMTSATDNSAEENEPGRGSDKTPTSTISNFRQSKISQFDVSRCGDQHIVRFQISVEERSSSLAPPLPSPYRWMTPRRCR